MEDFDRRDENYTILWPASRRSVTLPQHLNFPFDREAQASKIVKARERRFHREDV